MRSTKITPLARIRGWFWLFLQLSLYAFALDVSVDLLSYEPSSNDALGGEEIAAPLLALCASILGMASNASSKQEMKARFHGCALWCIAILSSYFWLASLRTVEQPIPHWEFSLVLLYLFLPSAVIGIVATTVWVLFELYEDSANKAH